MFQDTQSFGEGYNGESFTLFLAQTGTMSQMTRQNSCGIQIPEENVSKQLMESSQVSFPSKSEKVSSTLTFKNDETFYGSSGKFKKMLGNKENIPKSDNIKSIENKQGNDSYMRELSKEKLGNPLSTSKMGSPVHRLKKSEQNISMASLKSYNGYAESPNLTMVLDPRRIGLNFYPDLTKANSLPFKDESLLRRSHSRGKIRIDITGPNSVKESFSGSISVKESFIGPQSIKENLLNNRTKTMASRNYELTQPNILTLDNSSKIIKLNTAKISEKQVSTNQKKEKKKPKKVEVSLLLDESGTQTEINSLNVTTFHMHQHHFTDGIVKKGEEIRSRSGVLRESISQKNFRRQTFQPENQERSRSKNVNRTFDQFLDDQNLYEEKRKSRIKFAQLRSDQLKLENSPIPHPTITPKTQEIIQKRENDPFYEKEVHVRLYELAKYKNLLKKDTSMRILDTTESPKRTADTSYLIQDQKLNDDKFFLKESYTFQPKLQSKSKNIKRGEKVETLLYKDAIRRQNKSFEIANSRPSVQNPIASSKSSKLLTNKLTKEFEEESLKFFSHSKEKKFNYLQMCEFLKRLRFIRDIKDVNSSHYIHQRSLLHIIWTVLRGDRYDGVSSDNLRVFLLAIMGLGKETSTNILPSNIRINTAVSNETVGIINLIKTTMASDRDAYCPSSKLCSPTLRFGDGQPQNTTSSLRQDRDDFHFNNPKDSFTISQTRESDHKKIAFTLATEQAESHNDFHQVHDTSLGISNILTRKFSFQSEFPKATEPAIIEDDEIGENEISLGTFDKNKQISFTKEEITKISQTYDVFYCNRLHSQTPEQSRSKVGAASSTFQPEILTKSKDLANNYREKQLLNISNIIIDLDKKPPADGMLSHADLLIYQGLSSKHKMKKQKEKSVERELDECTFKPHTNSFTRLPTTSSNRLDTSFDFDSSNFRGERLYKIASNKKKPRVDRSSNDIDFEKSAEHCTFQPKVIKNPKTPLRLNTKTLETSKDFTKSVERMKKGRAQREYVRIMTEPRSPSIENLPRFKFTLEKQESNKKSKRNLTKGTPTNQPEKVSKEFYRRIDPKKGAFRYQEQAPRQNSSLSTSYIKDDQEKFISFTNEKEASPYTNFENYTEMEEDFNSERTGHLRKLIDKMLEPARAEKKNSDNNSLDRIPLLYVDVNFGVGKSQRIMVYEGDTAESLANSFAITHHLEDNLKEKLRILLQNHMARVLSKIEEEMPSTQSEVGRIPPNFS